MRLPFACCRLSCVAGVDFFFLFSFFFSSFPFSISIWTSYVPSCLFVAGTWYYAGSSVSVSAATRLAYDMYLDTYADLTFVILVLRPFVTQVFSGSKMGPFHETHKNIIL